MVTSYIHDRITAMGKMPLFQFKESIQEEVVHILYFNVFYENFSERSFYTFVYKVFIIINPDVIAKLLGVPWVTGQSLEFSIGKLTMAQKSKCIQELYGRFVKWYGLLKHLNCWPMVKFLHRVFTYNLLPTTHHSKVLDDTAYLIDGILTLKRIDLASIISHMMLKATEEKHSRGSMPFLILITKFLTDAKVPFKVKSKGGRGATFGFGTLSRMGLVAKADESSTGPTFRPAPYQVSSTKAKSIMMSLLYRIKGKVYWSLKS